MTKRTIVFDNSLGRFSPDEAFIMSDEGMTLSLYGLPVAVSDKESYYLMLQNDAGEMRTHRIRDDATAIEADRDFLIPGELRGKVIRNIDITTVKTWEIEPLKLVQLDSRIEASPVIATLEKTVAALTAELKTLRAETQAQLQTLKASVHKKITSEVKAVMTATDENAADLDCKIKAVADIVKGYMRPPKQNKKK